MVRKQILYDIPELESISNLSKWPLRLYAQYSMYTYITELNWTEAFYFIYHAKDKAKGLF